MTEKRIPPMGDTIHESRICMRNLGFNPDGSDIVCGKPAAVHIFWTPTLENTYACAECSNEALSRWSWWRYHALGPCCGMPGSLYFEDENVCRYEDGLPVAEVKRERELAPV